MPAMELRNTRTTILNQGDADAKREEIRHYFHATYSLDEHCTRLWLRKKPSTCGRNRCDTR